MWMFLRNPAQQPVVGASARIMFGRNDCGGKSPNGLGCCVGRVVVAGTPSGGDCSGRRIQRHLGQQLTGRGLTHRPRVARIRGPLGVTACDVLPVGYAEIGQCGTVVDAAVGSQAAQIPPPGVDLDWVQVRLPLGPLRAPRYLISASTVPWVIAAPVSTANPVITPSLCAVTGFSIFIASRTTTRSPVETSCPSSTATLTTVPCIGAVTASPDAAAPPWAPRLRGLGFLRMTPPASPPPPLDSARSPGSETSSRRPPTSTTTFCRGRTSSSSMGSPEVNGSTVLSHSVSIQRVCTVKPLPSPMNAGSDTTARW